MLPVDITLSCYLFLSSSKYSRRVCKTIMNTISYSRGNYLDGMGDLVQAHNNGLVIVVRTVIAHATLLTNHFINIILWDLFHVLTCSVHMCIA